MQGFSLIEKDKALSLWYSGEVIRWERDGFCFTVVASGDIEGHLYKNGVHLAHFIQKEGEYKIRELINTYFGLSICSDKDLLKLVTMDSDYKDDMLYLEYTNVWKLKIYNEWFSKEYTFLSDSFRDVIDDISHAVESTLIQYAY